MIILHLALSPLPIHCQVILTPDYLIPFRTITNNTTSCQELVLPILISKCLRCHKLLLKSNLLDFQRRLLLSAHLENCQSHECKIMKTQCIASGQLWDTVNILDKIYFIYDTHQWQDSVSRGLLQSWHYFFELTRSFSGLLTIVCKSSPSPFSCLYSI